MTSAFEVWSELAGGIASQLGWNARRIAAASNAGILIAVRKPDNVPALLIEVSTSSIPPIAEYPGAEGFQVLPEPMVAGLRGHVRLCLVLANDRYRDVFGVLVDDVVADLRGRTTEDEVVRGFLARLRSWQIFMRRHGATPLDLEAQIGLVAELLFLRDHVLSALPPQAAVSAWVGPLGRPQDFSLDGAFVEVKASTGGVNEVQISSLDQLDTSRGGKPIVLCWAQLLSAAGPPAVDLPQIVAEVRGIAGREPTALRLLDERLLEVGYLDAHERHYAGRLYQLRAMTFYQVSGAFPRIERVDVRDGVTSCSYVINLSACEQFEISAAETNHLIRGRNT